MGKNSMHLVIIGILGIIFFGLMFASTSKGNLNINYNFDDKITVDKIYDYRDNEKIGSVIIENKGYIPQKIYLDKYALCYMSEDYQDKTYRIEYKGNVYTQYDAFSYDYDVDVVELSSKETITLDIVPRIYEHDLQNLIIDKQLNGQEITLHLFKLNIDDNEYDYCSSAVKENAVKAIITKFDIKTTDLEKLKEDEKVYTY